MRNTLPREGSAERLPSTSRYEPLATRITWELLVPQAWPQAWLVQNGLEGHLNLLSTVWEFPSKQISKRQSMAQNLN